MGGDRDQGLAAEPVRNRVTPRGGISALISGLHLT